MLHNTLFLFGVLSLATVLAQVKISKPSNSNHWDVFWRNSDRDPQTNTPGSKVLASQPSVYTPSKKWALLLSGSKGYFNYRHQADVAHAYQTLIMNGFSPDRIVTMSFDDIAFDATNPQKGTIINHPGGYNVYDGLVLDYTGSEVNIENLYYALTGEAMPQDLKLPLSDEVRDDLISQPSSDAKLASIFGSLKAGGKKIDATENDTVFVYFTDHGGPGVFMTPNGSPVTSVILNKILARMSELKRFKYLLMFLEACYAGSMFEGQPSLPKNVYVKTASNAHESSFATYYDLEVKAYLGDLFSVNWMEKLDDIMSPRVTTLQTLSDFISSHTVSSHVVGYGETAMEDLPLDTFFIDNAVPPAPDRSDPKGKTAISAAHRLEHEYVEAKEVGFMSLYRSLESETNPKEQGRILAQLGYYLETEDKTTAFFKRLAFSIAYDEKVNDVLYGALDLNMVAHTCVHDVMIAFNYYCGALDDHVWRQIHVLSNLCSHLQSPTRIVEQLKLQCQNQS